jgi:hypothetical protein
MVGISPAVASTDTLSLTAVVGEQTCLNGDTVQVDLSAQVETTSPAKVQWDFTNDGTWDTARLTSPDVTHNYPDEVNVTAVRDFWAGGRFGQKRAGRPAHGRDRHEERSEGDPNGYHPP